MIELQLPEEKNVARSAEKSPGSDLENYAPLAAVLANEELYWGNTRAPDYAAENLALTKLVTALADAPQLLLQTLTDTTLELFKVSSAGISLLSKDNQRFFWPAISGVWKPHIGGGTPRHFGPCGDVLDANGPLLFIHPEKRYTYLLEAIEVPAKCLLVPFYSEGKAVGTIWIVSPDDTHRFDAEDLRLLESLGRFASAAYKAVETDTGLRENEERFRGFVTASADVIFRISPDWREMRQLIGRDFMNSTDVPIQGWLKEYVDPADHHEVQNIIHEAIHTKGKVEMENRVRRLDGTQGWVHWHAIPLLDAQGDVVEWIGSAIDVTEDRKIANALRDSEERYRNLFNSIDEGYCIFEMIFDDNGKPVDYLFLEVNPAFERHTGMADAVGKRMREFAPDHEDYWFEMYGQVAKSGEAIRLISKSAALDNRWFDLYAFKVGSSDSNTVAVLFTNITSQKQAEDALRASEMLYRSLFNSMDEGFCIVETILDDSSKVVDFRFLEVNPVFEQQSGLRDVAGRRMREVVPDHEEFWFDLLNKVLVTGETARIEAEALAMKSWFTLQAFRIGGEDSLKLALIFNNITERRMVERKLVLQAEALVELDRRKNEFLAMLSHELRNPLAPLVNSVQLMRLQQDDDPVQRMARNIIERQVGQLKTLVDDLLEISRITTGRVRLRAEYVLANSIVERAIETMRPNIHQRRHKLVLELPSEPLWLNADAARLEQVMVNLLGNAAKFTDEGGRIQVTLAAEGDEVIFSVHDNGVGISAEHLPHIFDMFTQADRSLDRSQGGLGIGLCLVQRLVEMHGGTVTAKSAPGEGSEFVVRLPRLKNSVVDAPTPIATENQQHIAGCFRILVVDDNKDAANSLSLLLEATGHETRIAFDGLMALEVSREFLPDVVLLDIGLPGLNGYEVAKQMRQLPGLAKVVLVALTGYGREADRALSQTAGFDHHLVKPADFQLLQVILAGLAERGV